MKYHKAACCVASLLKSHVAGAEGGGYSHKKVWPAFDVIFFLCQYLI